jgi:hypothetical protein
MRLHPAVATALTLVGGGMILIPLRALCDALAVRPATGYGDSFAANFPQPTALIVLTLFSSAFGAVLLLITFLFAVEPSRGRPDPPSDGADRPKGG